MRATLLFVLLLAGGARALELQGHVDLYTVNLGAASASLHFEENSLGGSTTADADIDAGARPEIGVRALLESGDSPWMVGVELGQFSTDNPQLEVDVMQVAVVGGVRAAPLFARHGRGLRPYLLAGISSVVFDGRAKAGDISVPVNNSSGFLSSGAAETAPVLAAGLEWQLSPRAGIVVEYRWREYDVEGDASNSWILPTSTASVDGTLDASGLAIGISWWPAPPAGPVWPPGEAGAGRMPAPAPAAPAVPASDP